MAGRIRTLKPEILENERTAALEHDTWRLFVSLLLLADDYGNLQAHPARLRGAVFWAREARDVADLLHELQQAGLIRLYRIRGRQCIHIIGWSEHQKVDKPGHPRVPGPEQADAADADEQLPLLPPATEETVATGSRNRREIVAPDLDLDQYPDQDPDPERDRAASASPPQTPLPPRGEHGADHTNGEPTHRGRPLPFRPDEALRAIANASSGRFVATKLTRGQAINAQRIIRAHPNIGEWSLVGEWLGAGGEAWKTELDARSLGSFEAWLGHATKWRDDGKPPLDRHGSRATPARRDLTRGQVPVVEGLDYSAGAGR